MSIRWYGDPVDSLHFDEGGFGPLPIFGGASVQVGCVDAEEWSENYPPRFIHLRTRPFGGMATTVAGARELAAQLTRAADDAEAWIASGKAEPTE